MKRLTDKEIKSYIETNEWKGKAGAYGIQGSAEKFIQFISGSYTNIVGLPLNQVYGSLNSIGYYNENFSMELGDIYQTWGRGLILNQLDYQNLDFDTYYKLAREYENLRS